MAPMLALVVGFGVARLIGYAGVAALDGWHPALRIGLALMFTLTGIAHFRPGLRRDLIAMVPQWLPRPDLLVTATGVLELLGGAGLLLPATARAAAGCLVLLMLAMFPANVSAARRKIPLNGRPPTPLVPRSALQLLFIATATAVAFA